MKMNMANNPVMCDKQHALKTGVNLARSSLIWVVPLFVSPKDTNPENPAKKTTEFANE